VTRGSEYVVEGGNMWLGVKIHGWGWKYVTGGSKYVV
jgi:hypothetical protein